MTVDDLIRELSELGHIDRQLEVEGVDTVAVVQHNSRRYVVLNERKRNWW